MENFSELWARWTRNRHGAIQRLRERFNRYGWMMSGFPSDRERRRRAQQQEQSSQGAEHQGSPSPPMLLPPSLGHSVAMLQLRRANSSEDSVHFHAGTGRVRFANDGDNGQPRFQYRHPPSRTGALYCRRRPRSQNDHQDGRHISPEPEQVVVEDDEETRVEDNELMQIEFPKRFADKGN